MKLPVVKGVIDRRILANFRIQPEVLARVLPSPFKPKLVGGYGIGGVCLIRLKGIRPRWAPRFLGVTSENAAHRIAVEWGEGDSFHEGVYIPRRDTSSRMNTLLGGRCFPGEHHHARFTVEESADSIKVDLSGDDGLTRVVVVGTVGTDLPQSSVFPSLDEASRFFEKGSLGYSATSRPGEFDGLELRTSEWKVEPLDITQVESSYFQDLNRFPEGSVTFDCALLMRNIRHEWHGRDTLYGDCCTDHPGITEPTQAR